MDLDMSSLKNILQYHRLDVLKVVTFEKGLFFLIHTVAYHETMAQAIHCCFMKNSNIYCFDE